MTQPQFISISVEDDATALLAMIRDGLGSPQEVKDAAILSNKLTTDLWALLQAAQEVTE